MGSHSDVDHGEKSRILQELKLKAELMEEIGKNRVTQDRVVEEWTKYGVRVQMLPDDPHGVLRISIGGHPEFSKSEYCNFRGDQGRCIALLEKCLKVMKSHTP